MALKEMGGGIRGGVAFLTRVPINTDENDWDRFRSFPAAFPLVGYLVGAIVAIPFAIPMLGASATAFGYFVAVLFVVGIAHLDGVADFGDAMAVHGEGNSRVALKDTACGAGAIVAVAVVVSGLVLAAVSLAALPPLVAVGVVVAAEVGAKFGMATVACIGTASHEGMGSAFTRGADSRLLVGPALAALPAAIVLAPVTIGTPTVAAGPVVAVVLIRWADDKLGGVNGDVFGATNEVGRVVALHAGVIAWTLS